MCFFKRLILSLSLFCISFNVFSQLNKEKEFRISASVVDKFNNEFIPFAHVYVPDVYRGTTTDSKGFFSLSIKSDSAVCLKISCLGYQTKVISVNKSFRNLKIYLNRQSIQLKDFNVSAKYKRDGTAVELGQQVLEYIQPISIQDIFLLLPGALQRTNNMQSRSEVSIRQAGSDMITNMGLGVIVDGIPIHNDGMRVQMDGFTGNSSVDPDNNLKINSGIDLRTISTDHIETIVVNNGIASASKGNLSSGLIDIKSKFSKSPLRIRSKIDPLNRLFYIGKGLHLSEKLGLLHLGADITKSSGDIRDTKSAYNRISSQVNYTNCFMLFKSKTNFNFKISYVKSFNNNKKDQKTEILNEKYKSDYQRLSLSSRLESELNKKLLDKLEFNIALSSVKDKLSHRKFVSNPTVICLQSSLKEGESETSYLPKTYHTYYEIDNRPLDIYNSLDFKKVLNLSKKIKLSLNLGNTVNYTKNLGYGAKIDSLRPPFPSSTNIRARKNRDIPSMMNNATYLESKFNYRWADLSCLLSLGVRGTKMLNLPKSYELSRKYFVEPRLQFSVTKYHNIRDRKISNSLRIGYGVENKLPSLDYLYPDKVYRDVIVLNAYFTEANKRLAISNTKIYNPENYKLKPNKNSKYEIGWDIRYRKLNFSLTCFKEIMNGGIQYFSKYIPIQYTDYYQLKKPINSKPNRDDYYSRQAKSFAVFKTPTNSAKLIKKGVEYRFSTQKLNFIKSSIEINGAYYKTLYTSGIPVMFRSAISQNNQSSPYVGYYDGFEKKYRKQFNTNLWFNTHLSKFRLIFTNFIQLVWLQSYQEGDDIDVYPSQIMDLDGNLHKISPEEIESESKYLSLKRQFPKSKFNLEKQPFSMTLNLKLTKELGDNVRLSFFANNIIDITPSYKSRTKTKRRQWNSPFFSTELIIKL
ncbi:MAG: TonB-dependent receptor [Marinifilaceae bacterium]|nr:TonB-dependent receptor [Marinifilaceae bacterium]